MAGRVRVDGRVVTKAGTAIGEGAALEVEQGPAFVSRGGDKLATALTAFGIDVSGLVLPRRRRLDRRLHGLPPATRRRARHRARRRPRPAARAAPPRRPRDAPGGRQRPPPGSGRPARPGGHARGRRRLVHLALARAAAARGRPRTPVSPAAAREAAVRGRARRGQARRRARRGRAGGRARAHRGAAADAGGVVLGACESGHPGPAGNREFFLHIVSSDHPDVAGAPADPLPLLRDAVA